MTETSEINVVRAEVGCKEWIGEDRRQPPPVEAVRPERCPACGVAARPVGGKLNLHAHSKHRMRGIRGVTESPETGNGLDDGDLEVVDTRIAIRRYRCVDCETTCTVLPAELRIHAEILRTTVALALALWSLHPAEPSAGQVRDWMFPDDRRNVRGWPQLRRWAESGAELVDLDEVVVGETSKPRAGEITQICRARAPPELRDRSPWSRATAGATHPQ